MKILLIFAALLLSSCSKDLPLVPTSNVQRQEAMNVETLKLLRVKELFVVLFPKNYTVDEWKFIFDETKELSANKKRLRALEGMVDAESQDVRANLIGKNADLLTDLGNKSLFMMSWSASDENCKIKDSMKVVCRPSNSDNPLNGGLPKNLEPLSFVVPDPVSSEIKTPYLLIRLEQNDVSRGPWYRLDLRLKVESLSADEKWFKGDVVPAKGSTFIGQDGSMATEFFPYGYSELTLSP